ncbi:rhamnulokinase family protein [Streptosporangium sp. NPDC000396]|uniref:rhamnulokinase n=1 Tax=Streptosporangium sp. NPDC000396 TaxID=3366185 RepID=UPI0036CCF94B
MKFAAVDLGASSGRVMVAGLDGHRLELTEVHRFANRPVRLRDRLHWDVLALYQGVLDGLAKAGPHDSIGVDSWAVDYGLLDARGNLLGNPVCYRDSRTSVFRERIDPYELTGLQFLPFNTIYQLLTEPHLDRAATLLMIPDLIAYWLTGELGAERTNASTTGLYGVRERDWARPFVAGLGIPAGILPPIREPGEPIGLFDGATVTAVGSHDTASAVAAVPASGDRFAYISCGTWALAGVELTEPVLTEESRAANFTNETGIDGTVRYLRNVMGLWLLQESMRTWGTTDVEPLLEAAARLPARRWLIDPDGPEFLPPGDMPSRIAAHCGRTGAVPETMPEITRCILDSLAAAFHRAISDATRLSGKPVDVIHIVGGGARNALLCQLTADACGLPVVAGPVEATALGNVLVQARARGLVGSLDEMRALVAATRQTREYEPRT